MTTIRFPATDGFELAGTLYGNPANATAAVLIVPAMGVAQGYYAEFARWLAAKGQVVLSFDYRGMGASRPAAHAQSLRGFDADIQTWAERDAAAALAWLRAQVAPGVPLHWVGHSLGGQIFGLLPNRSLVDRAVTVASGSGYWRENAPRLKRIVWWMWFVLVPLTLPLAGYFPGRRLKKVGDLPRGVMAQWRRWCLSPHYMMGEGGAELRQRYTEVDTPMLSLSFTDDEFMSGRNIESLHGFYDRAPKTMQRVTPAELGVPRIGHFGFFRPQFQGTLWTQLAHWLDQSPTRLAPHSMETA
ncbi:MAG TPA: alpha/beta fold hydrolase [Ideonella sp.]|uniref:alpha/beta hydrolase family protein n=1 Tax=Ideonella sp. TaxID=1929293 RepID=UPI002E2F8E3A|nr:alpha/beta fold hydrolase [Ideonella sp.]HEX5685517.1 alpha/beta fold hydrolase [Ideonella sp.]